MLSEAELLKYLDAPESAFVERKASFSSSEAIRKTILGFANSLRQGEEAVLFFGADDSGNHSGLSLEAADKAQKHTTEILGKCFPPINCRIVPLKYAKHGKELNLLAVIVGYSTKKPHFGSPFYLRQGSQTLQATEQQYLELLSSLSSKANCLRKAINSRITVRWNSSSKLYFEEGVLLEKCDDHHLLIRDDLSNSIPLNLESVQILKQDHSLKLKIESPWTDNEQVQKMLFKFLENRPILAESIYPIDRQNEIVKQFLANPNLVIKVIAAATKNTNHPALRTLLHLTMFESKKANPTFTKIQIHQQVVNSFYAEYLERPSDLTVVKCLVEAIQQWGTSYQDIDEFLTIIKKPFGSSLWPTDEIIRNAVILRL